MGPPGAGKTLLARALPGILPKMSIDESLDVTRIYSVADQLPSETPLMRNRPFRVPHHTISHAGLVGGGNWLYPGRDPAGNPCRASSRWPITRCSSWMNCRNSGSRAETGTIVRVLEVLGQPLEDKVVTISRAQGSLTFLANFQLVWAMNPCP
jgi:magnesium chelatase family protein